MANAYMILECIAGGYAYERQIIQSPDGQHNGSYPRLCHSRMRITIQNLKSKYRDRFPEGHTAKHEGLGLRIYDVGVDANAFKPLCLEQIATLMHLPLVKKK